MTNKVLISSLFIQECILYNAVMSFIMLLKLIDLTQGLDIFIKTFLKWPWRK